MNGTKRAERIRLADILIARIVQALAEAGGPVRFVEAPQPGDRLPADGGPWRGNLVTPCGAMLPFAPRPAQRHQDVASHRVLMGQALPVSIAR